MTHFIKRPSGLLFIGILLWLVFACESRSSLQSSTNNLQGVADTRISIGASLALGGHAKYLGTQTLQGAMCYLNHINETGGVHGRTIQVIAYDDGYDPPRCVANTQKLIVNDKVFALFCYVGTPTTVKIIPIVTEAKIPLVGMFTGANALRSPLNRYLINVRASYYQETGAAIKHLVKDLNIQKVAIFYQYDAYGFDGLRGTELALRAYGLVPKEKGTYIRGTLDVEEGLSKIMASDAEAVIMIGTYDPCTKFIRMARNKGYEPVFCNVSFVGADELSRRLGKDGDGVLVTQVVPPQELSLTKDSLPGTKEYVKRFRKYYPDSKPSFVGLEGYINAQVLVEGLRRAGRHINRNKFITAIESIKDYNLGIDNPLTFGADDHQGLDRVYFTMIRNGMFELITDWKAVAVYQSKRKAALTTGQE